MSLTGTACVFGRRPPGKEPGRERLPKAVPSELVPGADSPPRTVGSFASSSLAPAWVARPPRVSATGCGNSEERGRRTWRQTFENANLVRTERRGDWKKEALGTGTASGERSWLRLLQDRMGRQVDDAVTVTAA